YRDAPIECFPVIGSTNDRAKELAAAVSPHHATVLAEAQTAGRGRRGREFYSPAAGGLYMTMLLRPEQAAADAQFATVAAAVAVCRAIETLLPACAPGIKWVNDVYVGGRKACGILAEAGELRDGRVMSMVVGVGVNVSTAVFPPELREVATALPGGAGLDRNRLAAEIMNAFFAMSDNNGSAAFREGVLAAYRERSIVLGREVTYDAHGAAITAKAVAINDRGNLVVRLPDGTETALHSGEISVRLAE
ncbi:MAG: biotin--[acetyl-CoA-carboxylase] ligase, partial [Planctomycetes bacterium]|nr:biotin--[acetyl-CoA-carboxylase] ligase [Planctomycetota bacterium]